MPSLNTEATFKMNVAQLMKWQQQHPEAAAALFAASVANQPELQQAQGIRSGWDRAKHEIKMVFNWEGYRQRLEASIFTDQLARTFPAKEIEGPKSQAVAQLQTPVATAQELAYGLNSPELTRRVDRSVGFTSHESAFSANVARRGLSGEEKYGPRNVQSLPGAVAVGESAVGLGRKDNQYYCGVETRGENNQEIHWQGPYGTEQEAREVMASTVEKFRQPVVKELSEQVKAQIEQAGRWEKAIVEWVRNPEHEAAFQQLDKALSGAMTAQRPNLSDVNRQQTLAEMRNNLKDASKILNKPLELGGNVGGKVKQEFAKKWPEKKLAQQIGVGI